MDTVPGIGMAFHGVQVALSEGKPYIHTGIGGSTCLKCKD